MSHGYDVVLFDMDGTLVDTDLMLVETSMELFRKYRPGYKISLTTLVGFSGPPIEETLHAYFPTQNAVELVEEYKRLSSRYYNDDAMLFPHTIEALDHLVKMGVRLGIVTNKHRQRTLETLELLGISKYFEFIIGYDDVKKPKPDPEGINKCLAYFKVSRERVLFIGDTIYDYAVARGAGVDVALAAWTLRRFSADVKPDIWLDDYSQLAEVVQHGKPIL